MKNYRDHNWKRFRREIIDLDGGLCNVCRRGEPEVILQVHHKKYIHGKLPWEYSPQDCITLCKGCHAAEHGIIPPKTGWEYIGDNDLGDLIGNCDLCGSNLRHQFFVFHENWGTMEVGTYCCDSLTDTEIASNSIESKKRFEDRKKRFINSNRWKKQARRYLIKQNKIYVSILGKNTGFSIKMNGILGKAIYASLKEAKAKVFEVIENGKASEYLEKHNK